MSKENIKKAYGLLAQEYYETRKNKSGTSYFYNELLEFPTTLKILGNIRGKKILDLGCGPGIHAKKMQALGAKVKGIDISEELLALAKAEAPKVEFTLGNANKLPYENNEFDIVVSSLVMNHINDWNSVLREVRRVLKKNGIFVFSGYNPVTEKVVKIKWFFRKFRILKDYFKEEKRVGKWRKDKNISADITHYHKTYGTIVKLLVANGFEILDYEDCKPAISSRKGYEKYYDTNLDYPHFCVWKVEKK